MGECHGVSSYGSTRCLWNRQTLSVRFRENRSRCDLCPSRTSTRSLSLPLSVASDYGWNLNCRGSERERFFFAVRGLFCIAGSRPGRRGPFVSAKGPQTRDAPSGSYEWTDPNLRRADQLAPLIQVRQERVPPWGQPAGVGAGVNPSERHLKARGTINSV